VKKKLFREEIEEHSSRAFTETRVHDSDLCPSPTTFRFQFFPSFKVSVYFNFDLYYDNIICKLSCFVVIYFIAN